MPDVGRLDAVSLCHFTWIGPLLKVTRTLSTLWERGAYHAENSPRENTQAFLHNFPVTSY